jgi:hypothetical protein
MTLATTIVSVALAVLVLGATPPASGACKDEPTKVEVRRNVPLAEVRLLLAELDERRRLISMRIEQQRMKERPDLEEMERLLCALRRESSTWRDLMNLKHEKEGCLLVGFPPRCSIQL